MDLESPGGNNSPGISNGRRSHTTEIGSKCVRCGDLAPSLLRLDRLAASGPAGLPQRPAMLRSLCLGKSHIAVNGLAYLADFPRVVS